jgi:hypothetical protein
MSIAGVEPGHGHELPTPLVQRVRLLTRAVVIFGVCLVAIGTLLVLVILQRGEQRDREQAESKRRSAEQTRQTACAILEALPVGPLLDSLRAQFECGRGIPLDQLPPAVREQLAGRNPAVTPPPLPRTAPEAVVPAPAPDPMRGATLDPPRSEPSRPGDPRPAPTPESSPAPLVDLNPITGPVCDALGVCP